MLLLLQGEQGKIEISIFGRNNPDSEDYWDANWVQSQIKIAVPGFQACYYTDLRLDELKNFHIQLEKLLNYSADIIEFKTMEEGLYLQLKKEYTGAISCQGKAIAVDLDSGKLEFNLKFDFPSLEKFYATLQELLIQYPIVGVV